MNRTPALACIVAGVILIAALLGGQAMSLARAPQANPLDVVINEVAWSGTLDDYNDEWIELYNNTAIAVDLSGWTLVAGDGSPDITLAGTIPAHGFYLLERSDDDAVADTMLLRRRDGEWHSTHLDPFLPDGRRIRQAVVTIDALGRVLVVAGAPAEPVPPAESWWGQQSMECFLLVSEDEGVTFAAKQISPPNPEVPNWLPNISRTGPNHDLRRPLITYTEGVKGEGCAPPDKTKVWAVWVD